MHLHNISAKVLCGYDARAVQNATKFTAACLSLWPSPWCRQTEPPGDGRNSDGRICVGATILVHICCGEDVINIYHIVTCWDVSTSSVPLCKSAHLITAAMLHPISISLPSLNSEWKTKFQWHQQWWDFFFFYYSIKPEHVSLKLSKPFLSYSSLEVQPDLLSPSDSLKPGSVEEEKKRDKSTFRDYFNFLKTDTWLNKLFRKTNKQNINNSQLD